MNGLFRLDGRTALITGAGGGLGREIALGFAEAGADVACAGRTLTALEMTVRQVRSLGRRALAVRCDVSDENQVADAVAGTIDALGPLDILVNNAGVADVPPARVHEVATERWHDVVEVNLHGVFYCSRQILRGMVERQSGKIVNIASMWGLAGSATILPMPAYTAAKGAVVNLTRELALEYAGDGIQVNCLCPGFHATGISDHVYDDEEFVAAATTLTPMRRIARACEIRGPALFLASAASDFMTGQTLVVDGGLLAG
ncbi:SDR family NAD(P)-dependent oxidoreductase [Kitasatospora sp. NPDC058046]|uniref:SDR family NAD(P)-dependent oxidoreductase n=1 Tax=Kitasatospora sp. NPDC058046 TaxID=3346312 RepID=UPI0036D7F919